MMPVSSHSSDLCRAVENIVTQDGLVGYRNVVSYVAALGLPVLPRTAMDEATWKWLGAGSFSTTFEGSLHHRGTASVVAIKQPNSPLVRDKQEVENRVQHLALSSMIQECRILAHPKLQSHPNLPHVIGMYFQEETGAQGVRPCLVMELAVSDFRGFLEAHARERRSRTDLARVCSQIANGLCALHAYGLVHGDVKPENVLMFQRGEVLVATVADLGTCGIQGQSEPIVGTPAFWAPEMHAKSPFRDSANRSSRDIYSFGLLVYAAVTCYREKPFAMPVEEQCRLQHEDAECSGRLLLKMPQNSGADHLLREVVRRCVRADSDRRPSIFEVCRMLEEFLGDSREFEQLQQLDEKVLLSNPSSPRVGILGQMSLPEHLRSKLLAEFLALARGPGTMSIRTALIMAASYGGFLGPRLETPWDWVAKAQWILKAVELGSYGTASMIVEDNDIMAVLDALGTGVLKLRRPFFSSPEVDETRLRRQVEEFAMIGDEAVASKIMPLICRSGADPKPPGSDSLDQAAGKEQADKTENETHGRPDRDDFLRQFTITRGSDLSFLDLDALDINFENKEDIVKSAYNNDLEAFIILLSGESDLSSERLHYYASVAVMNGSLEVVRFLTEQYGVGPNGAWQENTHFEDSILFGRGKIARYYLSKGVDLEPKEPRRPSVLHYLPRYDDEPLAQLVCNQLRDCGGLRRALSWVPTGDIFPDTTPLEVAMSAGAWKIARLTLQLGVEVDADMRIEQVLELAVTPRSPAVPIELLRMILRCGGDPNAFVQDSSNPALQWPVWTSNVLATQELLLHGAKPVLSDEHDFLLLAEEVLQQRRDESPVDVVDEDGKVIQGSWEHARSAGAVVLDMLTIAAQGQPEGKIQEVTRSADPACLGKYWMVVGKGPGMGAIEVETPFLVEATQG